MELSQPATSYLCSTHPDLIQQIIRKHAKHLHYVSFKVRVFPAVNPFSFHLLPFHTSCLYNNMWPA